MSWVATAVVGSAVVGGVLSNRAAGKAADATTQAASESAAVQREMFQETKASLAPFTQAGTSALQRLMVLTGMTQGGQDTGSLMKPLPKFDPGSVDVTQDPGYQFRLAEGEKAITRGALARGMNASTATLKELSRWNQGLASQEYGAAFDRATQGFSLNTGVESANKEQAFNMLASIAGLGQSSAAMTGNAGAQMANATSSSLLTAGAGRANAAMFGAAGTNQAIQGGLSNMLYMQRWDDMMKRMPVFGANTAAAVAAPAGSIFAPGNDLGFGYN